MPYSSPRLMISSPFEIKSPPKGSKVPLDFFKFPLKTPSKDGINSCSSSSELNMIQNIDFEFTCFALFPFDFTFNGRIFIIGNNAGGVDFVVALSDNVKEFILIGSKQHLFKSNYHKINKVNRTNRSFKIRIIDIKKN